MTRSAPASSVPTSATTPPSRTKLLLVLGVTVVAISTSGPMVVACGMDAAALAFWRVLIAGSLQLLLAVALERGALMAIAPADLVRTCIAGTMLGLHYLTFIASLEYTTVASATVLATSNPLWVALGAWIFLREKTSPMTWIAIVLGIAGAAILAIADSSEGGAAPNPLLGDAIALLAALTSSATLLIARSLRARIPTATYVAVASLSGAPVLLLSAFILGASFVPADGRQVALLLAITLVPHLIGNTALNWALGWLPAPRVAMVILCEPVGATLIAWAVLHQPAPAPLAFAGIALVFLAVALTLRRPPRPA